MSLAVEVRRDTNPTPTRFLFESGAFTPGLGMNLETYYPFDASLKFLSTGTPMVESNPFDSSFRPSYSQGNNNNNNNSLFNHNNATSQSSAQSNVGKSPAGSERQPWTDMMFDDVVMPVPQMSPSPTFSSASPSPPAYSPPTQTLSLSEINPSKVSYDSHEKSQKYEPPTIRQDHSKTQYFSNCESSSNPAAEPFTHQSDYRNTYKNYNDNDNEEDAEFDRDESMSQYSQDPASRRCSEVSNMAISMSELDMRRLSTISETQSCNDYANEGFSEFSQNIDATKTKKATSGSRKSKNSNTKSNSRKRSSNEEETPEMKRQRFLERNRMAASKCREKKRLQTLKTIEDADEITARNQALHETLSELQEEVRLLKNQILSHRGCGCDVIQKFVQTSFEFSVPSTTGSTYAIPQNHASAPAANIY